MSIENADKPGPNGEEPIMPILDSSIIRGDCLYNVGIMERLPNGKVQLITLTQCDFKIKVPQWILATWLPKAMKSWYDTVQKHYTKNHKKI